MRREGNIRVLLLAGAVLLLSGFVTATEPDGVIGLRLEWVAPSGPSDPGTGRLLNLGVRPAFALGDAQLEVIVPPGARWLTPSSGNGLAVVDDTVDPDGTRRIRIQLGAIPAAQRVIRLAFAPVSDGGAVVSLRVEGFGPDGYVSEAVGVTVGHPGAPGRERHGAREYRAVPRPEEAP